MLRLLSEWPRAWPVVLWVLAYAVMVDTETGDMTNPRTLVAFGEVPDASSLLDAA